MTVETKSKIEALQVELSEMREALHEVVVGLDGLVDHLLMAMLAQGHTLIEGVPGLAKTMTASSLAQALELPYQRIQFTPDLLPGDVMGTLVFEPKEGVFEARKGPIFSNIVLADELNRAPAKVQSALLEAMQEGQVTIGEETFALDRPFMVMATQNPIEQEGTYPLAEAQLDRFMFKVKVDYPSLEEEREILRRMSVSKPQLKVKQMMQREQVLEMQQLLDEVFMCEEVETLVLRLVAATRGMLSKEDGGGDGWAFGGRPIQEWVRHGASPRASIFLSKAARAQALLEGRDHVRPEDVERVAPAVLRHRVALSYQAVSQKVAVDELIQFWLREVEMPQRGVNSE